jgi:hypothetical protein
MEIIDVEYNLDILEKSRFVKFHSNPSSRTRVDPSGTTDRTSVTVGYAIMGRNLRKSLHSADINLLNLLPISSVFSQPTNVKFVKSCASYEGRRY